MATGNWIPHCGMCRFPFCLNVESVDLTHAGSTTKIACTELSFSKDANMKHFKAETLFILFLLMERWSSVTSKCSTTAHKRSSFHTKNFQGCQKQITFITFWPNYSETTAAQNIGKSFQLIWIGDLGRLLTCKSMVFSMHNVLHLVKIVSLILYLKTKNHQFKHLFFTTKSSLSFQNFDVRICCFSGKGNNTTF